ncbi:para-nitrobenzyl esterase [Lindgomyces ingoldianus]|uniref:Para-nitrobenzyl esterase n=1 Tax=Lindgomyces ingoldianus TaxID=673940 RepID=A0ACB6QKN1_9PLEO|nr:para-nitrobenzyl esterase [Lindgomyces ingoldianus]KAF2467476.1 para-nitrobenzyl esterase [Lindgomyces ingoldianus]
MSPSPFQFQPPDLLHHPTLSCTLRGKISESTSTIQFRGLKYAIIPSRWQDSIPITTLTPNDSSGAVYDATHFGPSCPQKLGAQAWDLTLVGPHTLKTEEGQGETERFDEFECLHANVTVPLCALSSNLNGIKGGGPEPGLPVLIWVHGGALSMGSNSWPQYSLSSLVSHAAEIGKPIIGVALNYRVGIFGFLASSEVGAAGNYGYKDLVNGCRWVKRCIRGFGGDPRNVTAMGESAGAIALSTLLWRGGNAGEGEGERLFERVGVMSGDVTLRKPRGMGWQNRMYADQLRYLGLDGRLGKEERVKRLREMPWEEMCEKLPLAQHFCGCVDGVWLKGGVTLDILAGGREGIHKPRWCREFVVGDTAHDGTVLKARILDNPKSLPTLYALCKQHLSPSETHSLLSAYNLLPTSSLSSQKRGLLTLCTELRFYLPSLCVHTGWKAFPFPSPSSPSVAKSYRYHFHATNPFPGPFHGLSSHELDVAFLLQNYNLHLPVLSKKSAQMMAEYFIRIIRGEGWGSEDVVTVFGDQDVEVLREGVYDERFREGRGKVLRKIGAHRLWVLVEALQGVRADEERVEVGVGAKL